MSLWTRLMYGVPDWDTYYKENPNNSDTIEHFEGLTYNSYIPAQFKTFRKTQLWLEQYCPQCILPPMTYEEIINIIESLPNKNFLTQPLFITLPKFLGLDWDNDKHNFDSYIEHLKLQRAGYDWALRTENYHYIHLFYYWKNNSNKTLSEHLLWYRFKDWISSTDIEMPIFFNPKGFRDYALLCISFSEKIAKEVQKQKELEAQIEANKQAKLAEQAKQKEIEIRKHQIEMLGDLKKELQEEQDKAIEQLKRVSMEDLEIANKLRKEQNV